MAEEVQKIRGFKDILPADQPYWQFVISTFEKKAADFGFQKITLPIVEPKNLFVRAIGETTDIVQKEMFLVSRTTEEDNEKEVGVLRPEATASVVRAYIEEGMQTWPQPVKLAYFGPMFRADRPQKGRFREFWQFGVEVLGEAEPAIDALVILLAWQIFIALKLKEKIVLEINNIGCKTCRPKMKQAIKNYYSEYQSLLCPNCQNRLDKNPFRLLDCKEKGCLSIATGAPQLLDNLCINCKENFRSVLEYLDDLGIPYQLNPRLVRGLDYYTGTLFEIRAKDDNQRQNAFAGGGRYDELVSLYGGKSTPAIGFAAGIERIVEKLIEEGIKIPDLPKPDIFIIQLGQRGKKKSLPLIGQLTQLGYGVDCSLGKESLKGQLRAASKQGIRYVLIIGQRESYDKTAIFKDMEDGSQETVKIADLEKILKKKIRKK